MKLNPSIAVIVPVWNELSGLPALIQRLNTLPVEGYILVDGGSNDGSRAWLDTAAIRWIPSGKGRAAQMNAGAGACKADIYLFLHADTLIDITCIESLRNAMQSGQMVGGRFDVQLSGSHPAFRMIAWFINMRSRLSGINTGDQCQFVRRTVFESMGGFADLSLMEDVDFSKRLKRMGKVVALRNRVITSSRRWERHGVRKTILLMWRLRWLYFRGVSADKLASMYREAR